MSALVARARFLETRGGERDIEKDQKGRLLYTVATVEKPSEVRVLRVEDCRRYSRFVKVVEFLLSVLEHLRKMRFRRKESHRRT